MLNYDVDRPGDNLEELRRRVVDLSGSYETKFSRHLIFGDVVFKDNFEAGR